MAFILFKRPCDLCLACASPSLAGGWLRREYALVYRAGLSNQPGPFEVSLRNESYNFAHFSYHGCKFGGKIPPMTASTRNSWF
jgi:hypothetical protein